MFWNGSITGDISWGWAIVRGGLFGIQMASHWDDWLVLLEKTRLIPVSHLCFTPPKKGFLVNFPLTDSGMQSAMLQPITIAIPQIHRWYQAAMSW